MIYISKSADNISDALKKKAIWEYLACPDDSLEIRYLSELTLPCGWDTSFEKGEYGKPYVAGSNFGFNMSHTENLYAVAVMSGEVGLDIQKESPRLTEADIKKIIPRFFVEDEQKFMGASKNITPDFYRIFTKKEALVKLDGGGIGLFTSHSALSCAKRVVDLTEMMSAAFGERVYGAIAW